MSTLDFLIGNETIVKCCSLLLTIMLFINLRSAFKKNAKEGTGYFLLFLVMTIYCVFYTPKTGDNYSSMENYYAYLGGTDWEYLHFERIYFYLMDIIPFGYVYYRLVLWGGACLLCVWLLKKMEIKSQIATLSVLTFALPLLLYYQRAALAYVLLYLALFCYTSHGELFGRNYFFRKMYRIMSIIFLLCALPFHTTMSVYAFFILSSFFIPKNRFGISLLLLVLLVFSFSLISNSILILNFFQEDTAETGLRSLENDTGIIGQNFIGSLGYFLHWLPCYCMIIHGLYMMVEFPTHHTSFEKICLVNTFILIAISLLFISNSFTIQIKFRNAAMMPWTLYLTSYYTRNCGSRACSLYALATIPTFFI